MSYILDALKKAEAERDQGAVPGLHTPAPATPELDLEPAFKTPSTWLMTLGVGLVIAALGGGLWWTQTRSVPPPASEPEVSSPTVMPTPEPEAQTVQAMPPAIEPKAPVAQSTAAVTATTTTAIAAPPPAPAPAPTPAPIRRSAAPIHVDPAGHAERSIEIPSITQLPDAVRRQLPTLAVSGAMYSDDPRSRMVLINNRVFHEGDEPMAGLKLEEIRLKSAVFNYQGTRYAVSY